MKVIWQKETAGARIVALGTFDGVHRGHRELLDSAIRYARENGIPFSPFTAMYAHADGAQSTASAASSSRFFLLSRASFLLTAACPRRSASS